MRSFNSNHPRTRNPTSTTTTRSPAWMVKTTLFVLMLTMVACSAQDAHSVTKLKDLDSISLGRRSHVITVLEKSSNIPKEKFDQCIRSLHLLTETPSENLRTSLVVFDSRKAEVVWKVMKIPQADKSYFSNRLAPIERTQDYGQSFTERHLREYFGIFKSSQIDAAVSIVKEVIEDSVDAQYVTTVVTMTDDISTKNVGKMTKLSTNFSVEYIWVSPSELSFPGIVDVTSMFDLDRQLRSQGSIAVSSENFFMKARFVPCTLENANQVAYFQMSLHNKHPSVEIAAGTIINFFVNKHTPASETYFGPEFLVIQRNVRNATAEKSASIYEFPLELTRTSTSTLESVPRYVYWTMQLPSSVHPVAGRFELTSDVYAADIAMKYKSYLPGLPALNLMVIGAMGSGKTMFINAVASALGGSYIKDAQRPGEPGSGTRHTTKATEFISLTAFGSAIPINFIDTPGITHVKGNWPEEYATYLAHGWIPANHPSFNVSGLSRNEIQNMVPHAVIVFVPLHIATSTAAESHVVKLVNSIEFYSGRGYRIILVVTGLKSSDGENSAVLSTITKLLQVNGAAKTLYLHASTNDEITERRLDYEMQALRIVDDAMSSARLKIESEKNLLKEGLSSRYLYEAQVLRGEVVSSPAPDEDYLPFAEFQAKQKLRFGALY